MGLGVDMRVLLEALERPAVLFHCVPAEWLTDGRGDIVVVVDSGIELDYLPCRA